MALEENGWGYLDKTSCHVSYFKKDTHEGRPILIACSRADPEVFEMVIRMRGSYPEFRFEADHGDHSAPRKPEWWHRKGDDLLRALSMAWKDGHTQCKADLRSFLGIHDNVRG